MTISSLTKRSIPNHEKYDSRKGQKITRVNVHHWAGTQGGEQRMMDPDADVSCNYLILSNGDLVSNVPEEYRAWTSGYWAADAPAITVEVQNSDGSRGYRDDHPEAWPVSDAAYKTLINLIADVAKRYGWKSVTRDNVRGHREFVATACPGGYLWHRLPDLATQAHSLLVTNKVPTGPGPSTGGNTGGEVSKVTHTSAVDDGVPGPNYWTMVQQAGRDAGLYPASDFVIDGVPGNRTRYVETVLLSRIFNAANLGKKTTAERDGDPYNGSPSNFSNFVWLGQKLGQQKGYYPSSSPVDGIDGPNSRKARVRILSEWLNAKF